MPGAPVRLTADEIGGLLDVNRLRGTLVGAGVLSQTETWAGRCSAGVSGFPGHRSDPGGSRPMNWLGSKSTTIGSSVNPRLSAAARAGEKDLTVESVERHLARPHLHDLPAAFDRPRREDQAIIGWLHGGQRGRDGGILVCGAARKERKTYEGARREA